MPAFLWEARTRTGDVRNGEMEAVSAEAVKQRLASQQLQPLKVKRKPIEINLRLPGSSGVSTQDLVVFTRQFSTMLNSGLPLVQALDILGRQSDNPEFKKVLLDVKDRVEGGSTFADALARHPKVFDQLFVNLVAAGEMGGVLDTIIVRLGAYLEMNTKMVKKVKGALTYPAVVVAVAGVVVAVMLLFVIPVFQGMFSGMGAALPGPTQLVVDMSQFMRRNWLPVFGALGGAIGGFMWALKTERGSRIFDRVILKAPIVGPLVQKLAVARFTRTLGTMLTSGVSILDAMDIVARSAGNSVVADGILTVRQKVSEGKSMAQELSAVPIFPNMVVQMIAVGEQTGAMDAMLNKIADFYDEEVDAAVGTMMSMLEPLIMMFLAAVLGGLVITMYLPVFSLAGAVGQ